MRFFGFHTVDVGGEGVATWQRPDKSGESFCRYLLACAWARLGLPRIWQVDNETTIAGFPAAGRIFTAPVRLARRSCGLSFPSASSTERDSARLQRTRRG
ncbi:MAG: hypothetical protein ACRDF0_05660 [Candidatus Limnocylindria bacterium]